MRIIWNIQNYFIIFAPSNATYIALCNAKIEKENEKANEMSGLATKLPLKEYVDGIADRTERYKVKEALKAACRITTDSQLWRILNGRQYPDGYQREAMAEFIRWHSGSEAYTAESLFPKPEKVS